MSDILLPRNTFQFLLGHPEVVPDQIKYLIQWVLNLSWSFLSARNYLKTFKRGTQEASWGTRWTSHLDRGRHTANGCGLDSNPSQPLSATWYMITNSSHWAKQVRSGAYIKTLCFQSLLSLITIVEGCNVDGLVNWKLWLLAQISLHLAPISLYTSHSTFPSPSNKIPRYQSSLTCENNPRSIQGHHATIFRQFSTIVCHL